MEVFENNQVISSLYLPSREILISALVTNYAHTQLALWDYREVMIPPSAAHQEEDELDTDYTVNIKAKRVISLCKGRVLKIFSNATESSLIVLGTFGIRAYSLDRLLKGDLKYAQISRKIASSVRAGLGLILFTFETNKLCCLDIEKEKQGPEISLDLTYSDEITAFEIVSEEVLAICTLQNKLILYSLSSFSQISRHRVKTFMKKGNEFVVSIASYPSAHSGILFLSTSLGRVLEIQLIQSGGLKVKQIAEFESALYDLLVKQSKGSSQFLSLYYLTGHDRMSYLYEFIEGKKARREKVQEGGLSELRAQKGGLIMSSGDAGHVNLFNSDGSQICTLIL